MEIGKTEEIQKYWNVYLFRELYITEELLIIIKFMYSYPSNCWKCNDMLVFCIKKCCFDKIFFEIIEGQKWFDQNFVNYKVIFAIGTP